MKSLQGRQNRSLVCDAGALAAILSSLKGLNLWNCEEPSAKALGYFQKNVLGIPIQEGSITETYLINSGRTNSIALYQRS